MAFATLLGIGVGTATAQNNAAKSANGFKISPVRQEMTVEKGKSDSFTITIENPTTVSTIAKPIVNDFIASDKEDGEPLLILDEKAPAPKNSFKKLVQPLQPITLGPKEKKNVEVTISVPSNSGAGGYYGAIRFIPATPNDQSTVGLTASVGTLVLVRVPGDLTERLDLVQLSAARDSKATSFFMSGNVQVLTRIKNTGDIHEKPFGKIIIKNMFGKKIADLEVNNTDPRANILPGSTRKFINDVPKQSFLGRYTIEANIGYTQGGGELISGKASFWYLPLWSILLLVGIVLLIVGAIYWVIRKNKTHKHSGRR